MVVIMQNTQEKAKLQKVKVNGTKKERFVWMEINFIQENNGGHWPCTALLITSKA